MPVGIGLMSGTSIDGVDAALVHIDPHPGASRVQLLSFVTLPFPAGMREAILRASDPQTGTVDLLCRLNVALGEVFAAAALAVVRQAGVSLANVDFIGSHGQTVHHLPAPAELAGYVVPATLQLGEPCVIAERTGLLTVADFRPRDMAAGGEGAPLAPYGHHLLFADAQRARVVLNIGGISNATVIPAGSGLGGVLAFDTGPGNMPIDGAVDRLTGGHETFDQNGLRAARGQVQRTLLAELMAHAFLQAAPPKSTGREAFGRDFVDQVLMRTAALGLRDDDCIATLTAFTAASIADAYRRFILPEYPEVDSVLCGGGSRNPTLVAWLQRELPQVNWCWCDDLGIPAEALEAVIFAVLAHETLCGRAASVPSATGAKHPVILGKIVPGRDGWQWFQTPGRAAVGRQS